MDVETAANPYPQPVIAPTGAGSGEVGNSASLQANGGNPDGSGTPVTGGWPPPAK